ncbi:hypothetical protein [Nostoc sp.]|uniref:hypothetical protein n=1 Tax=Nostoc sp. TaxID=1180 RepID=UPI002FF6F9FF
MSTTGYANAPFNNLRAVFAIFCMAPSFGFGSGAMSTTGYAYASDAKMGTNCTKFLTLFSISKLYQWF